MAKRTIVAIKLDHDDDPSWYNGPPYALAEHVFDEFSIEGLSPAPKRRTYDDSGRSELKVARDRVAVRRKVLNKKGKVASVDSRDKKGHL